MTLQRVTVRCLPPHDPAAVVEFMMGRTPAPSRMYRAANYTDGAVEFSVTSGLWEPWQIAATQYPEVLAGVTKPDGVNDAQWSAMLQLAADAQANFELVYYTPDEDGNLQNLNAYADSAILAVVHPYPQVVLDALGLTRIQVDEP